MSAAITVNGDSMPWTAGMTVRDILRAKNYTFKMLAVWIDDSPVDRERFDRTTVPENAKVQILHMISGG